MESGPWDRNTGFIKNSKRNKKYFKTHYILMNILRFVISL